MLIGVDVGGTHIKAVRLQGKKILKTVDVPTPKDKKKIILVIKDVISELKVKGVKHIGIGIAGPIDRDTGKIYPPNIPALHGVNFFKEFKYKIPVTIENDANCFVLAEQKMGAGKKHKHVLGITLGTGIGGGIVLNGKLYRGRDGAAGELGHMVIDAQYNSPGYEIKGSFESLCSGRAIENRAHTIIHQNTHTVLKRSAKVSDMIAAAQQGDSLAKLILADAGTYLGIALASLINIFNPECIVLGGSVAKALPYFRSTMDKQIAQRGMEPGKYVEIVQSKLEMSGAIGAALLK
jgi:glucokinase